MRIMGIDPGLAELGWGIIEVQKDNKLDLIKHGCISTSNKDPFTVRLGKIYNSILDLVNTYRPDEVAVEKLFFSSNAKTAIAVAHARGAIFIALSHTKVKVSEYTPLQIKQALVGYGRAAKEQVQFMVKNFLHLENIPESDHSSDALAAALCHNSFMKMNNVIGSDR